MSNHEKIRIQLLTWFTSNCQRGFLGVLLKAGGPDVKMKGYHHPFSHMTAYHSLPMSEINIVHYMRVCCYFELIATAESKGHNTPYYCMTASSVSSLTCFFFSWLLKNLPSILLVYPGFFLHAHTKAKKYVHIFPLQPHQLLVDIYRMRKCFTISTFPSN